MRRTTFGKMRASLGQAESAVHREPDIRGVFVFLPVILPPANRAKAQRLGRIQRLTSTAGTAKTSLHANPHDMWTGIPACGFT